MQAPITALALILEFAHTGFELMIPLLVAIATTTAITRDDYGYSIYFARLPANRGD